MASSDSSSSSKRVLIAASISAVAAATAALYYSYIKSNKKNNLQAPDVKEEQSSSSTPSISAETSAKILEEIIVSMSNVMMQLAKIEQKVREESSASGTPLPEDQLAQYLSQNFEESLKSVSSTVYAKHKVTEESVQEACEYYVGKVPAVHNSMVKLQQMIMVATGQPLSTAEGMNTPQVGADGEIPDDIELGALLKIVEETFETMACTMEATCQALIQEQVPKTQMSMELQTRYTKLADEATVKIFESHGVTREAFHNATIKYGNDPEFLQKMQEFQEKQASRFRVATESLELQ